MQKIMKLSGMFAFVLVFSILSLALASAAGTLRAVPPTGPIVANGVTQYPMIIQAESDSIQTAIQAIQSDSYFNVPSGYAINYVSTTTVPFDDFFSGYNTIDQYDASLTFRSTMGGGPSNHVGNFAIIYFTVTQTNPRAKSAMASFMFKNEGQTFFYSNNQFYTPNMVSASFQVIPGQSGPSMKREKSLICPPSIPGC